jgi:hypothetical protein
MSIAAVLQPRLSLFELWGSGVVGGERPLSWYCSSRISDPNMPVRGSTGRSDA